VWFFSHLWKPFSEELHSPFSILYSAEHGEEPTDPLSLLKERLLRPIKMAHLLDTEEILAAMEEGKEDLRRYEAESAERPAVHDHAYRDLMKVNGEYQTQRNLGLDGS